MILKPDCVFITGLALALGMTTDEVRARVKTGEIAPPEGVYCGRAFWTQEQLKVEVDKRLTPLRAKGT